MPNQTDDLRLLQPPGSLLRYLMSGWTVHKQIELRDALSLSPRAFEMLMLGARQFEDQDCEQVANFTGIPSSTFRDLEYNFTSWCSSQTYYSSKSNHLISDARISRAFSAEEISRRVAALALEMSNLPQDGFLFVPILKGAFMFAADLIRLLFQLKLEPIPEFAEVRSYASQEIFLENIESNLLFGVDAVWDKTVLVIDDICDTGSTLNLIIDKLKNFGAASVLTCTLFDKTGRKSIQYRNFRPDYVGFTTKGAWMVGYGMDNSEGHLRGSPEVGVVPDRNILQSQQSD